MRDLWDTMCDRWEYDSVWREQILLAAIVGMIGLAFTIAECFARRALAINPREA